jgi:copper chaperone
MRIFATLSAFMFAFSVFASRVEVEVNGMTCGVCVSAITKEMKATEKVENVIVSLENKKAAFSEIKGKKISDSEVRAAIKKAGYHAAKIRRY